MKYNPFKPGAIVHPGMFAGRTDEIDSIEKLLFQTKNGNSSSFLITGERGIGKSSLLLLIEHLARGNIKNSEDKMFNFIVVSISLDPGDNYEEVVLKIARELQRELDKNERVKALLKTIWSFITNWEVMGVKYNKSKEDIPVNILVEDLSEKLISILGNLDTNVDGIYVFIDEADKPNKNPELGALVKSMTERMQRKGVNNFAFGIIGLPNIKDKIKASHESALRIFTAIPLKTLLPDECDIAINLGLKEALQKNGTEIKFDMDSRKYISTISEGYPHFIQQYAYSAFEKDIDNNVDVKDVIGGLIGENGALAQLGERYFVKMYFRDVYSTNYRKILGVIANNSEEYITKQKIIEKSGLVEYIVTNALTMCTKKGLILKKKGSRGSYKISTKSFAVWIMTLNSTEKEL